MASGVLSRSWQAVLFSQGGLPPVGAAAVSAFQRARILHCGRAGVKGGESEAMVAAPLPQNRAGTCVRIAFL
jgi:hypothetical protein